MVWSVVDLSGFDGRVVYAARRPAGELRFVPHGADVAEARVAPLSVLPRLHELEDGAPRLILRGEVGVGEQLVLYTAATLLRSAWRECAVRGPAPGGREIVTP